MSHPKSTGKVGKTGLYEYGYIISILRLCQLFSQFFRGVLESQNNMKENALLKSKIG